MFDITHEHVAQDVDGANIPLSVAFDLHGVTISLGSGRCIIVDVGSIGDVQIAYQADAESDASQLSVMSMQPEDYLV